MLISRCAPHSLSAGEENSNPRLIQISSEYALRQVQKRHRRVIRHCLRRCRATSDVPPVLFARQDGGPRLAGAFNQYEKARLVAKLKAARQRKRETAGNVEGRKSWVELNPTVVAEARRLRRKSPKGGRRSLRQIAAELKAKGFLNECGKMFSAPSVSSILKRCSPSPRTRQVTKGQVPLNSTQLH